MCFRIPVVREQTSAVVTLSHSLLSRGPPKAASVWEQRWGPAPLIHTHTHTHTQPYIVSPFTLWPFYFCWEAQEMFIIHQGSISLIQSSKLYIQPIYIPYWWETILETVLHLTFPVVVVVILLNHFQSKAANILVYVNIVIFFWFPLNGICYEW